MINTVVEEKTYLELSDPNNGVHKFYEVTTRDTQVTVRYGYIGYQGRSLVMTYPTYEQARKAAQRRTRKKSRLGFAQAIMGQRPKRPITRRQTISHTPNTNNHAPTNHRSRPKQAPIAWKFASGRSALGIFINEHHCWIGNEDGHIFQLDHTGQSLAQFSLPEGVKCLVADNDWIYAGSDDGNVYDLSGVAYQIAEHVDIYWLDIREGVLAVSDADGRVARINYEDETEWFKETNHSRGWMVRCGTDGIYHGHSHGVSMYAHQDGCPIWEKTTNGAVLFGWQEETMVYAGTSDRKVYSFTKQGERRTVYDCDGTIFSCATAEQGKYVFAGDNSSSIYCFDETGLRLWKMTTGCGSAYSMQFFHDHLYIVTTEGYLACIDVSEAAIRAAQAGFVPQAVQITAPAIVATPLPTTLETTSDTSRGVILECISEGGRLRMHVVSPGFDPDLKVQFPRNIREEGVRYVVDAVRVAAEGTFYRAFGDIKKLVTENS